jgi:hypothetical protein
MIFCSLVIVGVTFRNAEAGRCEPDHSAPGLGFRLSYDTNCQIKP